MLLFEFCLDEVGYYELSQVKLQLVDSARQDLQRVDFSEWDLQVGIVGAASSD